MTMHSYIGMCVLELKRSKSCICSDYSNMSTLHEF